MILAGLFNHNSMILTTALWAKFKYGNYGNMPYFTRSASANNCRSRCYDE